MQILQEELKGLEIGSWVKPRGGYFISFNAMHGCAKAIVDKCKQLGVVLTGAGATYPYGKDPEDSNIRIAPSFPTPEEMAEFLNLILQKAVPPWQPPLCPERQHWYYKNIRECPMKNFSVG